MESWMGYSWAEAPVGIVPRVLSASHCRQPARGRTRRIVHESWSLDYARSDCGLVRVGSTRGRWWHRLPRTAHLYPPDTPYWEDSSGVPVPSWESWVIFDGGAEAGLAALVADGEPFVRISDPGGRLDVPMYEIARAGHELGEQGFWRAQAALASVLDLLRCVVRRDGGRAVLPAVEPAGGARTELVRATHEFFRAHLGERVRLADVARHLAMAPSTLSHRYAAEAGTSPMAAFRRMRIEAAKGLLLRGLKMSAVARRTGFYDAFHLSKAFKKECGVAPSRFRRDLGRATL